MNPSGLYEKGKNRLNRSEIVYLAGCFLVYLLWAVLFTDDRYGPDEVYRVLVPRFICRNGFLPTGFEESVRIEGWGFSYAYFMSLPYLSGALFMKLTSFFTSSETLLLLACRMSSILSGVGTGFFSIKITKRISTSPLRWVFIAIMTLLPQMIFLSGYFNLDSFSLFTVMIIIYAWILGIQSNWGRNSCIMLAVGMGLCFLSYKFAWSYILCSFLLYVFWHAFNHENISFKSFILKGLMILGITFAICGWVFVRNYILYDGDFLALRQNDIYGEMYAVDSLKPSMRDTFKNRGESIGDMLSCTRWFEFTAKSFVCGLGYLDVFPRWPYFYKVYSFLFTFSAAGAIISLILKRSVEDREARRCAFRLLPFVFIASAIIFCLSAYYSWSTDYQPQGRYIICALPLLAAVTAFGLDGLVTLFRKLLSLTGLRSGKNVLPQLAAAGACSWIVISAYMGFEALMERFIYGLA